MQKEDLLTLAQLLSLMKEVTKKLEEHYKGGDREKILEAKKELMRLQKRIDQLL